MINSVRNTVLSVLNKNNYGYISPSDFNLFAKQAQLEVYEEYFSNYNKTVTAEILRTSGSDYADIRKALAETMESFLVSDFLIPRYSNLYEYPSTNVFYTPSLTTTGNEAYMINKIMYYNKKIVQSQNDLVLQNFLHDSTVDFIDLGVKINDIVVNLDTLQSTIVLYVIDETNLQLRDDIFTSLNEEYAIYSSTDLSEAEKVSEGKIALLNSSALTTPSTIYPAYTINGDVINIYPSSINLYGMVNAVYFRYPKEPKWTYITINGSAVFDQSQPDYQDFEMPKEDEFKLVMKILQYSGVSIRELPVAQFAIAQEQHEQPTFSQQQ